MSSDSEMKSCFDNEAIKSTSAGIVNLSIPHLTKSSELLKELCTKQETVLEEIHEENIRIANFVNNNELSEIFNMLKHYREKLTSIKKRMTTIHSRKAALKKRALRLLNQKEKEALNRVQRREREKALIGSTSSNSA